MINWTLLRKQKAWLLAQPECPEAQGLISLLDHLQDTAVDEGAATEAEVFGPMVDI
jgi:hypothetical protein